MEKLVPACCCRPKLTVKFRVATYHFLNINTVIIFCYIFKLKLILLFILCLLHYLFVLIKLYVVVVNKIKYFKRKSIWCIVYLKVKMTVFRFLDFRVL